MTHAWTPECVEDDLLVAFVSVRRGFQAAAVGGDPGRFPVLHYLAAAGPTRQGHLAEAIGLDASTVSRHVRTLLDEGLLEASRDQDDGRATVLSISPAGCDFLTDHVTRSRRVLQTAMASFSDAERAELVRLLRALADSLIHLKENA